MRKIYSDGTWLHYPELEFYYTQGEINVEPVRFILPKNRKEVDLTALSYQIKAVSEDSGSEAVWVLPKKMSEQHIFLDWQITREFTAVPGRVMLTLTGTDSKNNIVAKWTGNPAIIRSDPQGRQPVPPPNKLEQFEQQLNEMIEKIIKDYVLDTTVMGESSSTSKDKVFLLSLTEMGFTEPSGGVALGKKIDYFSSDARRIAFYNGVGSDYWTRSTIGLQPYYITSVGRMATISTPQNVLKGLRPAFVLPLSFKLKPTPNKDGSYDMYEESSAQTLATGKTIADLPSKSKVKLGRYGDADLQWLVSRNAENKLILVMSTESMTALGSKILDAAEPSNGNSDRQKYGNNRYIYTNLHQWLNAEKGANQWFVKAQTYDAPPDYTNVAGFLNGWKKEELDPLELAEWTVTKSGIDGSGKETFRSRVVLPSTTEMGFSSEDGGSKLDIFNSDSDR